MKNSEGKSLDNIPDSTSLTRTAFRASDSQLPEDQTNPALVLVKANTLSSDAAAYHKTSADLEDTDGCDIKK